LRHHDGEECFGGGWFIVVAVLPQGQISNHYKVKDWDLFAVPEVEQALFEYDGHTGADTLERLKAYHPATFTKITADDVTHDMEIEFTKQFTNGAGMTNDEMIAAAVNAYMKAK
jgi:hypothetical protein